MKNPMRNANSLPLRDETITSESISDLNQFLLNNKEEAYELFKLVKRLQEHHLLTMLNEAIENRLNTREISFNHENLNQLINGLNKGLEEATANLETGKDIHAFQLMKLLKDPDINRAVNFIIHFLKGIGKSLE